MTARNELSPRLSKNEPLDLPRLRQAIVESFSLEDLNDLCFELGFDSDEVPTGTLSVRARELVLLFSRRNDLARLLEKLVQLRPHVEWWGLIRSTAAGEQPPLPTFSTASDDALGKFAAHYLPEIADELRAVADQAALPVMLRTMLNYHLGFVDEFGAPASWGNKYIRGLIVLLCCEASGADASRAVPAAVAVQMAHESTLIHDDIQDASTMRRGRPTVWKIWGMPQAVNTGDTLLVMAHLALCDCLERGASRESVVRSVRALDDALVALTGGQHLDMSYESQPNVSPAEYMHMIEGKTVALIRASGEIGALIAGAEDSRVTQFRKFSGWLGVAWQLRDDLWGIWGDEGAGVRFGNDLFQRQKSLPVLYAINRNAELGERYFSEPQRVLTHVEVARLARMIEAAGGRAYTETAMQAAYDKALAALDVLDVKGDAGRALRMIAQQVLGVASQPKQSTG